MKKICLIVIFAFLTCNVVLAGSGDDHSQKAIMPHDDFAMVMEESDYEDIYDKAFRYIPLTPKNILAAGAMASVVVGGFYCGYRALFPTDHVPCLNCDALEKVCQSNIMHVIADYAYAPVGAVAHAAWEMLKKWQTSPVPAYSFDSECELDGQQAALFTPIDGITNFPVRTVSELVSYVLNLVYNGIGLTHAFDNYSPEDLEQVRQDLVEFISQFDLSEHPDVQNDMEDAIDTLDFIIRLGGTQQYRNDLHQRKIALFAQKSPNQTGQSQCLF